MRDATMLETYRYLRFATVLLAVMLGVAVTVQSLSAGRWETSISAYYWTPAHGAFIGALCAVGACLIVYKGNSVTEDTVLNFSGYLAFVVAMVPVDSGEVDAADRYATIAGVGNNVIALLVAGGLALVCSLVVQRRLFLPGVGVGAKVLWALGAVVLAAGTVVFVVNRTTFDAYSHYVAAVLMFAGIIAAVAMNAVGARRSAYAAFYVPAYTAIAALMVLAVVVGVGVARLLAWELTVLVLEAVLIVLFALYWGVQTRELWSVLRRPATPATPVAPGPGDSGAGAPHPRRRGDVLAAERPV